MMASFWRIDGRTLGAMMPSTVIAHGSNKSNTKFGRKVDIVASSVTYLTCCGKAAAGRWRRLQHRWRPPRCQQMTEGLCQ
mmetsp:Transcript_34289/g.66351  ORF Transcript_34289/g.66351 Transcript_34289/m.66351 type:complete len:80 (+) Transcript_34289:474-713(+)